MILRVGAAALNQTPMDWGRNQDHILEAILKAKNLGVQLLCLPEMAITGYGCEDMFHSPELLETAWDRLKSLVRYTEGITVAVGLPVFHQNGVWNCVAVVSDKKLLGLVVKRHLAGDGIHYENRWFRPWPEGVQDRTIQKSVTENSTGLQEYPIGDLMFEVNGVRLGFEICEDAWGNDRPGRLLAQKAVDIILNPSASHFAFFKTKTRQRFVAESSRAFGCAYIYANLLGNEAGRIIYDGETLIASGGELVARGPRFSYNDYVLTIASVDVDQNRMRQARTMSFTPDLHPAEVIQQEVAWRDEKLPDSPSVPLSDWAAREPWEENYMKEEEFTRAVCLGLYDYNRKSHSKGFVVSLSGGADSAACAVLVRYMAELVLKSGESHPYPLEMFSWLTCAYQASANSGAVTREAARKVAEAVGCTYYDLDISTLVEGYTNIIEKAVGRKLTWEKDDITLQNLQARVRAPSIWMFANMEGKLLLTTSNRSEMSVGYSTMDGDTAGGLAPLGGIDKDFIRKWLVWAEDTGPYGLQLPIRALSYVNAQQPTAELRPGGTQTDESDLMPYNILDAIEKIAIRDKRGPKVVLARMLRKFPQVGKMERNVIKYFQLWCRSQWKREKTAISFHLDDENLDPRSWCRYPVLSGGFEEELAGLVSGCRE